jgi:hypothetical protein
MTTSHPTLSLPEIREDLSEILPIAPGELYPPYLDTDSDDQKVVMALCALRRKIKAKERKMALINAYFLGKVFAEAESSRREYQLKSQVSEHYTVMADSTYMLFEENPQQILRTKILTVQHIKKLHRPTIRQLVAEVRTFLFVGTQSLAEENCYDGTSPQPQP